MKKIFFYIRDITDFITPLEAFIKNLDYDYEFHYDLDELINALQAHQYDNAVLIMDVFLEQTHKDTILAIRRKWFLPIVLIYLKEINLSQVQRNLIFTDTCLSVGELNSIYGHNIIRSILEENGQEEIKKIAVVDVPDMRQLIIHSALKKYPHYRLYEMKFQANMFTNLVAIQPHLILIDLSRDENQKLNFVNNFRHSEQIHAVPVIALIDDDEPELQSRGFEFGINEFFVNSQDNLPLLESYIYKILYNLHLKNAKRVLVVDDSPTLLQAITFTLQNQGFLVDTALGVMDALNSIRENYPDVMILDINLPLMNGFQFARLLKNDTYLHSLPIVAISGVSISRAEAFYAKSIGIEHYIIKPFNQRKIIEAILNVPAPRIKKSIPGEFSPEMILSRVNHMLDISNFRQLISGSFGNLMKKLNSAHLFWRSLFELLAKTLYLQRVIIRVGSQSFVALHPLLRDKTSEYLANQTIDEDTMSTYFIEDYLNDEDAVELLYYKFHVSFWGAPVEISLYGKKAGVSSEIDDLVLVLWDDFVVNSLYSIIYFYQLKTMDDRKNLLLRSIVHQLKNPVNIIENFMDMLLSESKQDVQPHLVSHIRHALNDLNAMSSELSQLIYLKTYFKPFKEKINFLVLVNQIIEQYQPGAMAAMIQISFTPPMTAPNFFLGDKELLHKMIGNVIDNAIKYSPAHSEINVRMGIQGDGVHLIVRDYGLGMDLYTRKHMFDEFFRATAVRNSSISGLGIGMTIVKEIARLHQVVLRVESEEGMGTSFEMIFPTQRGIQP